MIRESEVICGMYLRRQCPRSDMHMAIEHGNAQGIWAWTFLCRTCKTPKMVTNPEFDQAAQRNRLQHLSPGKKSYFV